MAKGSFEGQVCRREDDIANRAVNVNARRGRWIADGCFAFGFCSPGGTVCVWREGCWGARRSSRGGAFEGGRQGGIVDERFAGIYQADTPCCKVCREVFSDMLFQGRSRGLV